ncbi:MAG TPA: TetR/AcrR family transcriptional regulator C-terminal domain-containing protein, partial [Candidatus Acidoferrales bacterium]|nr:TetR/AcrR family transcriptional regulator C-terminal domain-containing protein [Candidatus Acidoferrales bacterium]
RAAADEQEALAAVAEDILRRNTEDPTLGRLLLFSALENHRLSHRFFRTHVARYYEALARHIRQGIRAGRFRRVDPLVAARGFLGMVVYHFLIQELFGGRRYQKFDTGLVCRTLAEIWLEGMRVSGKRRASARHLLRSQTVRFPRASKRERG